MAADAGKKQKGDEKVGGRKRRRKRGSKKGDSEQQKRNEAKQEESTVFDFLNSNLVSSSSSSSSSKRRKIDGNESGADFNIEKAAGEVAVNQTDGSKKASIEQVERKKLLERNEAVGGLKAKLGNCNIQILSHRYLLTST